MEAQHRLANSGQVQVSDLKKKMGKFTRLEKRQLKKGDKTILYEKLGLIEEKDLKSYQTKFGIKSEEMENEADLVESLADKSIIGKKAKRSRYHRNRETAAKDHFVNMLHEV